jgi:hypothetical protein
MEILGRIGKSNVPPQLQAPKLNQISRLIGLMPGLLQSPSQTGDPEYSAAASDKPLLLIKFSAGLKNNTSCFGFRHLNTADFIARLNFSRVAFRR